MELELLDSPVLTTTLAPVRAQARRIGAMVGLDTIKQTRFSTAVSEIARNAVEHANGGLVRFTLQGLENAPQRLVARITDSGPGLKDLDAVMAGRSLRDGRVSMGIKGSSRLVDKFAIESLATGGTLVQLEMELSAENRLDVGLVARLSSELKDLLQTPVQELRTQNTELLQAQIGFRARQVEQQETEDRKNQFVVTLAHELRSPLSTLQLSLAILRRHPGMDAAAVDKRYDVMERQVAQLTQLVEDLMDAGCVSSGKAALKMEPVELNKLVAEAVEISEGSVVKKGHHISVTVDGEPLWVNGDASRLKQVFSNLVQNSARYTPPEGYIVVAVRGEGTSAVVEVTDNGIGISPGDLHNIFGLFVQAERKPETAEGGLGVGLALVRRLVQDHGGTVVAASEGAGRGSQFTVTLPLAAAPPVH